VVGYDTDLAQAQTLVQDVAARQPLRLTSHDLWVGFNAFADSGVDMRVQMWVMPANVQNARSALILDIKQAFDAAGIDIPYPHQVAIAKAVKSEVVANT